MLIDNDTRVIVQGATGRQGRYHISKMIDYQVRIVGGVSPGKGGQSVGDIPVFDTVARARQHTSIDASMIMVPPAGVLPAAAEAIETGIPLLVIITEHVPFHDALLIRRMAEREKIRVIGPNTIGLISPGKCKIGVMPGFIYQEGDVGIISRSGTSPRIRKNGERVVCPPVSCSASTLPSCSSMRATSTASARWRPPSKPSSMFSFG